MAEYHVQGRQVHRNASRRLLSARQNEYICTGLMTQLPSYRYHHLMNGIKVGVFAAY